MLSKPRILLVFAHPDDEAFVSAGTARRYFENGAEISLVTATKGEAGRVGSPPACKKSELANWRRTELLKSADILGISNVHLLDYKDGQLAEASKNKIRDELVGFIRLHRPHVVLTFDPSGMTEHPDHVAIASFTMDAVVAAADHRLGCKDLSACRVQRLLWTSLVQPWDVTRSPNLSNEAGVDFVIDVTQYKEKKVEALRAHRTQNISIDRCFFSKADVDRILSIEAFRQAWGPRLRKTPSDDVLIDINLSE